MGEVNYIISIRNTRRHTMKLANTASSSSTPLLFSFSFFRDDDGASNEKKEQ